MSHIIQLVCCNPFQLPNHNKVEGLRPPSKKICANHSWLSPDNVVCASCRKKLSAHCSDGGEEWTPLDTAVTYSDEDEGDSRPSTSKKNRTPSVAPNTTVSYTKLVVPDGMRSMYWKHFGFPADHQERILTKDRIICVLCHITMAYKGNTSNLRAHLKNKHLRTLEILEATTPPFVPKEKDKCHKRKEDHSPVYSINMSGILDMNSNNAASKSAANVVLLENNTELMKQSPSTSNFVPKTAVAKSRQKKVNVTEDTLKLIATELLPPNLIQSAGFISFIEKIDPAVILPTSKQIKDELIPSKYNELRNIVLSEISSVTEISLSVEEWTGIDNQIFVTISVHFLNEDEFITRVLSTLPLNDVDAGTINSTFASWGLQQEHIVAIVTASHNSSLLEALQQWASTIPCFQHTIQQAVSACFSLPNVEILLWKCRTILSKYSNSNNEISNIHTDYPKIWTTTFDMLKEFEDNHVVIDEIIVLNEVKLSCFDWEVIYTIVEVLTPFQVTIQTLREENPPLGSIIKPLFWQLITNYLQIKDNETEFPYTIKSLLKSKLLFAYNNQTNNLLLQTATTLDPRFKQVSFSTNDERNVVEQNIKKMLSQFCNMSTTALAAPPAKKVCGMELLLRGPKQVVAAKDRATSELSQYTSEIPVAFDQSPVLWWRAAEVKYPTLIKLSRTFMCIPACVIPAIKTSNELREKFERQRANISLDFVDTLIFLNGNFK